MPSIDEETLVEQGALPPDDFHKNIERIREIAKYDLEWAGDFSARLKRSTEGLLISDDTLKSAAAALRVGHLVLQGPPGTGKSSLARALCEAFQVSTFPVTAHEDWSVFDVIGRLELRLGDDRAEEIVPVNGYVTEAVVRCANAISKHFDDASEPQAEWLLIDELNRAHMDRAFGELFTVLGTDAATPITLPHQREGNRNLVLPGRFRIIATLNSFDRQFVNNLSQAIRRRFTFITVDIPNKRPDNVSWMSSADPAPFAIEEYRLVCKRVALRAARRLSSMEISTAGKHHDDVLALLLGGLSPLVESFFDFIERVRYAGNDQRVPHLPIGTAQLIDTLELFFVRFHQDGLPIAAAGQLIDWAVSVKIVPLFDSDVVAPEALKAFAESLVAPFDNETRHHLLELVAAGMYFVE